MAGSLIKISETTIGANTAVEKIMGIDDTYNVYKFVIAGLKSDTNSQLRPRFTKASDNSIDESSNYDYALLGRVNVGSYYDVADANNTSLRVGGNAGANANTRLNGVFYAFNFSDSSEYSHITVDTTGTDNSLNAEGYFGAGILTVAAAHNGIAFRMDSGELEGGTISLYGLKK